MSRRGPGGTRQATSDWPRTDVVEPRESPSFSSPPHLRKPAYPTVGVPSATNPIVAEFHHIPVDKVTSPASNAAVSPQLRVSTLHASPLDSSISKGRREEAHLQRLEFLTGQVSEFEEVEFVNDQDNCLRQSEEAGNEPFLQREWIVASDAIDDSDVDASNGSTESQDILLSQIEHDDHHHQHPNQDHNQHSNGAAVFNGFDNDMVLPSTCVSEMCSSDEVSQVDPSEGAGNPRRQDQVNADASPWKRNINSVTFAQDVPPLHGAVSVEDYFADLCKAAAPARGAGKGSFTKVVSMLMESRLRQGEPLCQSENISGNTSHNMSQDIALQARDEESGKPCMMTLSVNLVYCRHTADNFDSLAMDTDALRANMSVMEMSEPHHAGTRRSRKILVGIVVLLVVVVAIVVGVLAGLKKLGPQ